MLRSFILIAAIAGIACQSPAASQDRSPRNHRIHDPDRPLPPVVDPGPGGPPAPAPSDAIVLFDGSPMEEWRAADGSEPPWKLVEGAMEVVPGGGDLVTGRTFGDIQLHVEYRTDPDSPGAGQSSSNSGVFIGPYEVQVLNSYENETYADGMNAAIYGQYPPLVNASRPPGEWQTYDIVYQAPDFSEDGKVKAPARITVFHNGVLVQNGEELVGPTSHARRQPYFSHGDMPLRLQDHGDAVRYRNIWARELE